MTDIEQKAAAEAAQGMRFMASAASGVSLRTKVEGAILVIAGVLAFAFWPARPIHENVAPAPAERQADGSLIAERAPDAHPAKPRHQLPKGAVEERREQVIIQPADPAASAVEVDLSLVREGDQRRVIASSPDGQVVTAIDIPIEPAAIPPPPKPWAAGLSYGTDRAVGVWVERDLGRLRVGAEIEKGMAGPPVARIRVGVRW